VQRNLKQRSHAWLGVFLLAVVLVAFVSPTVAQTRVSIDVGLPSVIDASSAESWGERLGWDEPTRRAVADEIERFLGERGASLDAALAPAREQAAGLWSTSMYSDPAAVERFSELLRTRHRAVEAFAAREDELFQRLADERALLAPEAADAARQLRRRDRLTDFACAIDRASIDLRSIAAGLAREAPIVIEDRAAWDALWSNHDRELASLHERRVREHLDFSVSDAEAFHRLGGDAAAHVAYRETNARTRLRTERAILAANERWLETLCTTLDRASARRFEEAVRRTLYPTIFPNPLSLQPLLDSIRIEDVAPSEVWSQVRREIEGEVALLDARETETKRMIVELDEFEALSIISQSARQSVQESVLKLKVMRLEAAKRVVARIEALPAREASEPLKSLKAAIEAIEWPTAQ
jgi:hypothetical protein